MLKLAFPPLLVLLATSAAAGGGWVEFVNETSTRLPAPPNDPATSTADTQEKDYAWGDLDQDGDVDLVVVRKQPFTTTGKHTNVLFMNEGAAEGHPIDGVLVDRTALHATMSDVPGDQGFLTPTNDRDVVVVDVDGDGWLDVVTAVTLSDNDPKHISHPRVYRNLGESGGAWLGLRYEDARIPLMHPTAGPRFCAVAAGDLTNDGFPDLYFADYDAGGPEIFDFNNRLLVNDGTGHFTDVSDEVFTAEMANTAFGAAAVIADVNGDGINDIVKQTSLSAPTHIAIIYNDPALPGQFDFYDVIYTNAPYFVSGGDLNDDGRLDLVVTDEGIDRLLVNQGNGVEGRAEFLATAIPPGADSGFGGNSLIVDLDKDGALDLLVADVHVDLPGCTRRMHILRNLGSVPNLALQEQGEVIPNAMLTGTHDVAVFDVNGDTWPDVVIGRCASMEIWINVPPIGLTFGYPQGLPSIIAPNEPLSLEVDVSAVGATAPAPGTGLIHIAQEGGPFVAQPMTEISANLYSATLPAIPCAQTTRFYVSAEVTEGVAFTDPPGAPASSFVVAAAEGTEITFRDELEGDVSGWTVVNDPSLASGAWVQADPNATFTAQGQAAPEDDATPGAGNALAFVTGHGPPGGAATADDVDWGPTYLLSPVIDLEGTDATISFARWFFCDDEGSAAEDVFTVEITNDGVGWTPIPELATTGTGSAWETVSFILGGFVEPTAQMQVRFGAQDVPNNSVTEAGIDDFQVEAFVCSAPCPADLDGEGGVGFGDLALLLNAWGPCPAPPAPCPADFNGNGTVGFADLSALLGAWGPCG